MLLLKTKCHLYLKGCVITRDSDKAADVWNMADAGKWYILETNYDHWKQPLFVDDRRTPANKCMQKMTTNVRNL